MRVMRGAPCAKKKRKGQQTPKEPQAGGFAGEEFVRVASSCVAT